MPCHATQNYRESAAAWQTVAVRQPSVATLAQRESVRALIAAGDLEPAMAGLAEMGVTAPAELLLRAADAHRAAKAFDRAVTLYRRAREAAGRTPAADEAALGLAATLEENGRPHEALETYRELQLTFRQASAFDAADAAARRLSAQLSGADALDGSGLRLDRRSSRWRRRVSAGRRPARSNGSTTFPTRRAR